MPKALLVLGGLFAGLLLVEAVLWVCDPFCYAEIEGREEFGRAVLLFDRGRPRLAPGVRTEYRDHLVVINSDGLRNREVPREKPPSTFRILALGGSVPFGWGVGESDCFPRRIEKQLNEDPDRPRGIVEVVNAAIPGYGLQQQLQQLHEIGPRYAPDMVLVPVMWNNVPAHPPWRSPPRFLSNGLRRNVRTLRLVEIVLMQVLGDDPTREYWQPSDLDPRGIEDVCFALGLFKQECDRLGARMVVLDTLGTDALVDACKRLGLLRLRLQTSLDWLARYRISDRDAHPNEEGHQRLAEVVVRGLRREIPR